MGRVLYSCLNDTVLLEKIQEFLQKKLSAIKVSYCSITQSLSINKKKYKFQLPSFMEDVNVAEIFLGETPPLIHRVSQPILDERGTWIDADITYEGLMHATITTKLNLLRLKKQDTTHQHQNHSSSSPSKSPKHAIYDSDAESSGDSSSECESPTAATEIILEQQQQAFYASPGNSKKILRFVDRITASNLFQSATEISYVQRAMENMSTNIKLSVELKGLVGRITINMPPPPSDRVWIS